MTNDKYGFSVNTLTMNPSFTAVYGSETGVLKGHKNVCEGFGLRKPCDGVAISDFLVSMGVRTQAFGFCGGLLGKYIIDHLKERGIGCGFVETKRQTPIKTVITENDDVMTVLEHRQGEDVSTEEYFELTRRMRECKPKPEYFVLSGTYPYDFDVGTYCDLIKMLHSAGIKTVTDFAGADMRLAFKERPQLVVMGYNELYDHLFYRVESLAEALAAIKSLTRQTGLTVLCTLGSRGTVFSSTECMCSCLVKRNRNENPYCRPAFVAAFIKAFEFSGENAPYALQYAAAYSAAVNENGDIPSSEQVKKNLNNLDFKLY